MLNLHDIVIENFMNNIVSFALMRLTTSSYRLETPAEVTNQE